MYRFLEHPSETLVEVRAGNPEEVFRDAALALFEIMTDTSKVRTDREFRVDLSAAELHLLLIDWLNRLIVLHETENVFFGSFEVRLAETDQGWDLHGLARGERIRKRHERRSHAKSATYGQLEWSRSESGQTVRFVIDV